MSVITSPFLLALISDTYSEFVLEHLFSPKINVDRWQQIIAKHLRQHVKYNHPEAIRLVWDHQGDYMLAAKSVMKEKTEEVKS